MTTGDLDPASLRASDRERDAVVAVLRDAAGDGRLSLEELSERLDQALRATTRGELEPLTADLPDQPSPEAVKVRRWMVAVMGGHNYRGRWRIAARCNVVNVMGGTDLDLREATLESSETEIRVFSLMGGSNIIVPDGVRVDFGGFALMGANDLKLRGSRPAGPGAPVVRVRAYSIMGGTDVKTRTRRG